MHRVDLLHAGAMAQGTLCVLPQGKKKQQKIAVGDDTGSLHVFYMKRGEVCTEWKQPVGDREIASVVLQLGKDKLFVGCGQSIHGFTRKGKEFVKIRTNLAETINHLFVHENMIWTGGEYIMQIYDQCKDFGFVTVKDRINALRCAPVAQGEVLSAVVACQDKCIRVYSADKLYHEFGVEGPGTALGFYGEINAESQPRKGHDPVLLIYGTEQGMVGLCKVDSKQMQRTASITDRQTRPGISGPAAATRRARVCTLHTADVLKSGALDFLVGRDDGNFEVWSLGDSSITAFSRGGDQLPPTLCFETSLQESIQSMDSGNITGGEHTEVVLTTYGGKVVAFTPSQAARDPTGSEMAQQEDRGENTGVMGSMMGGQKKMQKLTPSEELAVKTERDRRHKMLESEVDKLKKDLEREKAMYQKMSGEQIAMQTTTKVKHRFNLNSEEACYILTIDSQSPLELISLRADVDIDLLDHEGTGAILSRSKGDPVNPLLATYRMQEPGSRFQIKLRTVEGLNGTISCFVLPQTNPKTAHLVSLAVKPLSLHEKISEAPSLEVPMNELRLVGPFTIEYMHQWISLCVNELPSRTTDEEMVITYRSTFVGTLLYGRYTKGSATFRSDSITTISVLKDLITREATARKIHLKIDVEVKDETFPRLLELIHPKLEFQHSLTQQVRMVEPLREVQLQEQETNFLAPALQLVLQHATEIQQQFELQPQRLAFLHNIVTSAYRHKWRLRGHQSVESRIKELQKLLEAYNMEQIAAFFDEPID